eukprot:CAMPEP_0178934680 /NCGR_PEP_ID=MMETSP0786-20121207/24020_1 /TAXON_ID=186022 /ORGANISM="Thalassionema frauenfeldii, Strain CCMP 1798" /LENGTH=76 /DNA_ID=CAMNT_0020612535 /DNA_START=354 /DNA_END=584 /DNA_ORIENTATION=+
MTHDCRVLLIGYAVIEVVVTQMNPFSLIAMMIPLKHMNTMALKSCGTWVNNIQDEMTLQFIFMPEEQAVFLAFKSM